MAKIGWKFGRMRKDVETLAIGEVFHSCFTDQVLQIKLSQVLITTIYNFTNRYDEKTNVLVQLTSLVPGWN